MSFISLGPGRWTVMCCPGCVCLLVVRQSSTEAKDDAEKKMSGACVAGIEADDGQAGSSKRAGGTSRKPSGVGGPERSDHKRGRPRDWRGISPAYLSSSACIIGSRGETVHAELGC